MSAEPPKDEAPTVEQVIAAIRSLPKTERERLAENDELLIGLCDSLRRSGVTPRIAARLLSDALKTSLAGWSWSVANRRQLGLNVAVRVYMQDPMAADGTPHAAPKPVEIDWEPCLADGPTSSRVAVVDFDSTTGHAEPGAVWDERKWAWMLPPRPGEKKSPGRVPPDRNCPQFRQLNAWATVESALAYYENPAALGRPISWGFEGNRLIVVPHAGLLQNAYYDRASKSLQLYYCGPADKRIYTCLSHDIVSHETGHAILDGVRPRYNERGSAETAAFHEFVADLTAILTLFRDNAFRNGLGQRVGADLDRDEYLHAIGEQFGLYVTGRPYIRTAKNPHKMSDIRDDWTAHDRSQVLTGAMFDVMVALAANYRERVRVRKPAAGNGKAATEGAAAEKKKRDEEDLRPLWSTASRMSHIAIQPLDFCPPVDIRFADYAEAVLAHDLLIHREDPYGEREMMRAIFEKRGILPRTHAPVAAQTPAAIASAAAAAEDGAEDSADEADDESAVGYAPRPKPPSTRLRRVANIATVCDSRASAYRFLAQHRKALGIPLAEDFEVPEPYSGEKRDAIGNRLPRQYFIQYVWREKFNLPDEPRFGFMRGRAVTLPCGGTLVYDEDGNFMYWAYKPGMRGETELLRAAGRKRRLEYEAEVTRLVTLGRLALRGDADLPHADQPSVVAREVGGALQLEATPRLHAGWLEPQPDAVG